MIVLCIRYVIDPHKYRDFEEYARHWPEPVRRCGGELIGYYLPTKLAGPTNVALALIGFPDLAAYERYRQQGQRSLNRCSGKDFQQEVFVPTTTAAFHRQAHPGGVLLQ